MRNYKANIYGLIIVYEELLFQYLRINEIKIANLAAL